MLQGIFTPPAGSKVAAYVRSDGVTDYSSDVRNSLVQTLSAGLARARAGFGDYVVVLPGHSENVADGDMLDDLVSGTQIVGVGKGGLAPTFRWTATSGNWAVSSENVGIKGLRLRMDGANGITSGITVTAADCSIEECDIEVASGAALKATVMCTVGSGANRFMFANNRVRGTATHNLTDGILVSAAVGDLVVSDNFMHASATATNGLLRFTAAALRAAVLRNIIVNSHTSATVGIALGSAAVTGVVAYNQIGVEATTIVSGTTGISFSGSVAARFFNNSVSDAAASGIEMPSSAS